MTNLTDFVSGAEEQPSEPHSIFHSRIWTPWLTILWAGIIFFLFSISQLIGTIVAALRVMEPSQVKEIFLGGDETQLERALYELDLLWPAAMTSAVIGTLLILLIIRMKKGLSIRDYLNLRGVKPAVWGMWIGITILVGAAIEYMVALDPEFQTPFMKDVVENTGNLPMLVIAVGILAPIFEEVFFRGFVFKGLERSFLGAHGTIWLTSIVFALIHLQYSWQVMLLIIPMGLLLGYSRHYSGSLIVPIVIHVANNTVAIFLTLNEIHKGVSF
jgi:uncharacterized protein